MRLFFRKPSAPRWVDTPDLAWVPGEPFGAPTANPPEPQAAAADSEILAPAAAAPQPDRREPVLVVMPDTPAKAPLRARPDAAPKPAVNKVSDPVIAAAPPVAKHFGKRKAARNAPPLVALQSEIPPPFVPRALPRPANSNRPAKSRPPSQPPSPAWARLRAGLIQGLALYVLALSRSASSFPGNDPGLYSALWLVVLLAPPAWIEGLGAIRRPLLLTWTVIAATGLFTLGLYWRWRGAVPLSADLVLPGVILILAQVALHIASAPRPGYRAAVLAAWKLAARLLIWIAIAGSAWAVLGSGASLVNWLRHFYPRLPPGLDIGFVTMPLVGVASALGFQVTAGRHGLGRWTQRLAIASATLALPGLVLLSAALVVRHFAFQPLPMAGALASAALLLIGVNASYRWGWKRNALRRWSEFAATFLMLALTAIAAAALDARVAEFGWSIGRIYACAADALLACYAITYGGAALIGIGGGRWMQKIEPANILLAFAAAATAIALLTPLADPARLASQDQTRRLEQGRVDPAVFDFGRLRGNGAFGQDALLAMTHAHNPDIAKGAAIALSVAPGAILPTPTEIGANITVRTPGARLPNTLLARNWTGDAKAPPCLTKPALTCDAWFLDLDGDGRNEILLVYGNDLRWWAAVMKQGAAGWDVAATLSSPPCRGSLSALRAGAFAPADPLPGWRDLWVAGARLSPQPAHPAEPSCAK